MAAHGATHLRRLPISLRLKLTLWMVVISGVLQLTLVVMVLLYEQSSRSQFVAERMQRRAEAMALAIRQAGEGVTDEHLRKVAEENISFALFRRYVLTLYDQDGRVLASSQRPAPTRADLGVEGLEPGVQPVTLRFPVKGLFEGVPADGLARVMLTNALMPDGRRCALAVIVPDTWYEQSIEQTRRVLLIALGIGFIGSAVGGWMIARLATAPLATLIRIAGSLSPEGLDREVEVPGGPVEIASLQQELMNVRERLRSALQAQDRFISSVSHEIKTPIAVLLAEAQTIPQEGLTPASRRFAQSVTDEMRRLSRMVESFLTLTKMRGGTELTEGRPQFVNDFVIDAVASCRRMASQFGITLVPELVNEDERLAVNGDSELLRVMIDNLIHNAIRFSPAQGRVMIRVRDLENESECEVSVRDFGPGIPADMIERVFERFTTTGGDSAGRSFGLGLSIAQGIAELHGGRITARNLTEGCEFTVRLPLIRQGVAPEIA